ncbi:ABC transporter ATP-binding protein [Alkalinema pantanalense CENA528]|uniref:ABC transporter ATP-binding protein n=1 Tax=Alkalinema pantanalense TaxID=1620705 RepID=UPI003D6F6DA2
MLLITRSLTKQFDRKLALDQVNLELRQGDVYGLIGPNGAGKTTLLRLLALVDEPTTGEIFLDGVPLRYGEHLPELKRRLGFLPDDFPLYEDLTVWFYLDYVGRLQYLTEPDRAQRIQEVLTLVELESKQQSVIGTLSRGMRQRLSLAQAILHKPSLLLLDEPVSGLDPLARSQFRRIIKQLQASGMTILISSHILSDLEDFCTTIGIMEQGRLVESSVLSDLYDRLSSQHLLISVVDDLEKLQRFLVDRPEVTGVVMANDRTLKLTFAGNERDRAALLRAILNADISVTEFYTTQENLESIFLKMDYQRTS